MIKRPINCDLSTNKSIQAQMRMTSFFAKPRSSPVNGETLNTSTPDMQYSQVPRRRSQCKNNQKDDVQAESTPLKVVSDYEKSFLPFALPSNALLAPPNRFTWDSAATERVWHKAERWLVNNDPCSSGVESILENLELAPWEKVPRGLPQPPTRDVVELASRAGGNTVDVKGSKGLKLLKKMPMKMLCFSREEDIRPPYIGTFSKFHSRRANRTLGRNPWRRAQVELDYDHDSEAEWEEPDGEECDSEADSEPDSAGDAGEMGDFLDDEGAENVPRPNNKKLNVDMEPTSSGLCWENVNGEINSCLGAPAVNPRGFRMELFCGKFGVLGFVQQKH